MCVQLRVCLPVNTFTLATICIYLCSFHYSTITEISCRNNIILKSCQFSCLQWSLTTARGMKLWFSRAVTPTSAWRQMDLSSPGKEEPAWINRSSLNWQQMVHTNKCGRPWSNWHWSTHHHLSTMKMRWVTYSTETHKYCTVPCCKFQLSSQGLFLHFDIFSSGLVKVTVENQVKTQREREVIASHCHRGRVRCPSAMRCYWKTSCASDAPGGPWLFLLYLKAVGPQARREQPVLHTHHGCRTTVYIDTRSVWIMGLGNQNRHYSTLLWVCAHGRQALVNISHGMRVW